MASYLNWLCGFIVFIGISLYCVMFISLGIDVTDIGYNLYNQMAFVKGWSEYRFHMIWLSDLVGGAWQLIQPVPGLYGAKLGWCLLMGLSGVLGYFFLLRYFSALTSMIFAFLMGAFLAPGRLEIIYYNNVSAFLIMLAALCFLNVFQQERKLKDSFFWILAYAFFVVMAAMARFPSLIAIVGFPILPLVVSLLTRKFSSEEAKKVFFCYLASCFWLGVSLLGMKFFGLYNEYFDHLTEAFSRSDIGRLYTPTSQLDLYVKHFTWRLYPSLLIAFFIIAVSVSVRIVESFNHKKVTVFYIGSFLSLALFGATLFAPLKRDELRAILGTTLLLLTFWVFALLICDKKLKSKENLLALLLASFVGLMGFLGSTVALLNVTHGLWFLVPVLFYFLFFHTAPRTRAVIVLVLLSTLAIKAYQVRMNFTYRDADFVSNYKTELLHKKLKGIYTTDSRAKSLNAVLTEVSQYVAPGEEALFYNSLPIFYYLTEMKPFLIDSWPSLQGEKGVRLLLQARGQEKLPRVVVRALTNTQSNTWGADYRVPPHSYRLTGGVSLIDQWVKDQGYFVVWKNLDFAIFVKP